MKTEGVQPFVEFLDMLILSSPGIPKKFFFDRRIKESHEEKFTGLQGGNIL